jgi:hypothetical protein|tara:strand:+ start:297 stop:500 length:204 start_codon:yes stop_codon:yes gene_type:complete
LVVFLVFFVAVFLVFFFATVVVDFAVDADEAVGFVCPPNNHFSILIAMVSFLYIIFNLIGKVNPGLK